MDNTRRAASPAEVKLFLPGVSPRHLYRLSKCQNKSFTLTARQDLLGLVNFKLLFFAIWSLAAASLFRTDEQRLPAQRKQDVQLLRPADYGSSCNYRGVEAGDQFVDLRGLLSIETKL